MFAVGGLALYVSGKPIHSAELAFSEQSKQTDLLGSVVPASCDSNGFSTYDHNRYGVSNPGKKNMDGTYDVKPCPPTSCATGYTMRTATKYYCDYSTTGAQGTPSYTRTINMGWGATCPVYYANTILFDSAPNCNNITFTLDPDGKGPCNYAVAAGSAVQRTVNVNYCASSIPTVNVRFN